VEELLSRWDGESVHLRFDRPTGAWMIIAIHSTVLGPAFGGCRMKPYANASEALHDAQRLARGMTYKWAASGLAGGGGKAVIAVPPDLDPSQRDGVLRRFGSLVFSLGGLYRTGPDSGTTSADMDTIAEVAPGLAFCRTQQAGGSGDPAPFTALGVFSAIEATLRHAFDGHPPSHPTVMVQGVGSVGKELIALLVEAGAEVVCADVTDEGIAAGRALGATVVGAEEAFDAECHVLAPCALGGVLDEAAIPRLRCRAVVGAANNQLATPDDGGRLRDRGIVYAPDFVANAGGAIAAVGMEILGWSPEEARRRLVELIGGNLTETYQIAEDRGIDTAAAARGLAERRLDAAR
jgi:leucine dehydrogenase